MVGLSNVATNQMKVESNRVETSTGAGPGIFWIVIGLLLKFCGTLSWVFRTSTTEYSIDGRMV